MIAIACGEASRSSGKPSPVGQKTITADSITDDRTLSEKIANDPHAGCTLGGTIDSVEVARLTPHGRSGIYSLDLYFSGPRDEQLGTASIRADTAVIEINGADAELPEKAHLVNLQSYVIEPDQLRYIAQAARVRMRVIGSLGKCEWQFDGAAMGVLRLFARDEITG